MAEESRLDRIERLMEQSIEEGRAFRVEMRQFSLDAAKDRQEAAKDRQEAAKDRKDIKGIQRELAANLKQMGRVLLRIEVNQERYGASTVRSEHLLESLLRHFKSSRNGRHDNGRRNGGRRRT